MTSRGSKLASRAPMSAVLAVSALALGGCGFFGGDDGSAASPSPSPSPTPEFDTAGFCEVAEPLMVAVPREFVGTAEHVQLFVDVIEVAPEGLVADLATLRDHFDLDVDPEVPASQDFVNFPEDIQEVALAVDGQFREMCIG